MLDRSGPFLIFVEGLPGSGKSTLCQTIALSFQQCSKNARWLYEGQLNHPLGHPDQGPDENAWRRFGNLVASTQTIHAVDNMWMRRTVLWALLAGKSKAEIAAARAKLVDCVRGLNPKIVYLRPKDVISAQLLMFEERGQWFREHLDRLVRNNPIGASGRFRNWLEFSEYYADTMDTFMDAEGFQSVVVDSGPGDWDKNNCQALSFLGLPSPRYTAVDCSWAQNYSGEYEHMSKPRRRCTVFLERSSLRIRGMISLRDGAQLSDVEVHLLPKSTGSFWLRGWPISVTFRTDGKNAVFETDLRRTVRFEFGVRYKMLR